MALAEDAHAQLEESKADTRAMIDAFSGLVRSNSTAEILREVLSAIRSNYGWEVACYRKLDPTANALVFGLDSGSGNGTLRRLFQDREIRIDRKSVV